MADYHAVLQRTLSSFSDPKPELRAKLYDRARSTIRRQLEGRNPPVSGDALNAELDKLEQAITGLEQGYEPNYAGPATDASRAGPSASTAAQVSASSPETETPQAPQTPPVPQPEMDAVSQPEDMPTPPAMDLPSSTLPMPEMEQPVAPYLPQPEPEVQQPVVEQSVEPAAPAVVDTLAELEIPSLPEAQPVAENSPVELLPERGGTADDLPAVTEPPASVEFDPELFNKGAERYVEDVQHVEVEEPAYHVEPSLAEAETVDYSAVPEAPETAQVDVEPTPTMPEATVPPAVDPIEEWAKEFMTGQPAPEADPVPQTVEATPAAAPVTAAPVFVPEIPQEPIPPFQPDFDLPEDENLSIPPAPGFESRSRQSRKGRGVLKWLVIFLLLALLAAVGAYAWVERETLMARTGLASLFEDPDDPARPKPVKTITIKPDPEPQPESPSPEETKSESRLSPDGTEVQPSTTEPVVLPPTVDGSSDTAQNSQESATQVGNTTANGLPPVSQRAILYEEGKTAAENSIDPGRVVWTVVQEEPSAGEPKEPAIRGRIEIPSRNVVLLLTIKRNADLALPASHLIELVFAVPDDFSGGSIGQVSRFVLKESEQGRGDGLVGVPARIADGIFLIALNNLEQAVQANEQLLQTRTWIDIPLQYRTGRRALVTIEKGVPGEKVFKEVFEAWAKK